MPRRNRRSEREVPSWNRRRHRGWQEPNATAEYKTRDMTACEYCVAGTCFVHDGGWRDAGL